MSSLDKILKSGSVPSALILCGSGDLEGAAKAFFDALLGPNSPDLRVLKPEGKQQIHPINGIKELIIDLAIPPYAAPYKGVIIERADRLQDPAANALLKTLEEAQPFVRFILCAADPKALLPTILSRCMRVVIEGVSSAVSEHANTLVELGATPPAAILLSALEKIDKEIGDDRLAGEALFSAFAQALREKDRDRLYPLLSRIEKAQFAYAHQMRLKHALSYLYSYSKTL